MFGKRLLHPSDERHRRVAPQPAALFARYDRKLRARVRSIVTTSEANVEDACMYAWLALLRHELDEVAEPYSWLTTIAIREAVKLDRVDRRTRPLPLDEYGPQARPGEELAAYDLLAHAAAIIQEAGLTARQLQIDLAAAVGAQLRADRGAHRRQPPHRRAPDPPRPRQARRGPAGLGGVKITPPTPL